MIGTTRNSVNTISKDSSGTSGCILSLMRCGQEHRWMIGRGIALAVVAIGGVWALYLSAGRVYRLHSRQVRGRTSQS